MALTITNLGPDDTSSPGRRDSTSRPDVDPDPPRPNLGARRDAGPAFVRTLDLTGSKISAQAVTAVLDALLRHTDDAGVCWPKVDRLHRHTNVPERTIRRALDVLDAAGVMVRTRQRRADGYLAGYLYRLDVARIVAAHVAEKELDELEERAAERRRPTPPRAVDNAPESLRRDAPSQPRLPATMAARPPATMAAQEGITTEGTNLPLHPSTSSTPAPPISEGKAEEQTPEPDTPLRRLTRRLSEPQRRELAALSNAGGRNTLARLLVALVAAGWPEPELLDRLTADLPADAGVGLLLHRARACDTEGPPLDLDALAAQEAADTRARTLEQAATLGRNRATITPRPALDDVLDEAARLHPADDEARAAFVDAYRSAADVDALADELDLELEELRPWDPTTTRRGLATLRAALGGEEVAA